MAGLGWAGESGRFRNEDGEWEAVGEGIGEVVRVQLLRKWMQMAWAWSGELVPVREGVVRWTSLLTMNG